MNKAVFLDKDGTLVQNVEYNVKTEKVVLMPGVASSLKELKEEGYLLIIITNQSGIARGLFDEQAIRNVGIYLKKLLSLWRVELDGFYFCPHHIDGKVKEFAVDCDCRKPKPGMLYQAAFDHDIDLQNSWMIGDIIGDVQAGKQAGCRTILFSQGKEIEFIPDDDSLPDATASRWSQVSEIILRKEELYVPFL